MFKLFWRGRVVELNILILEDLLFIQQFKNQGVKIQLFITLLSVHLLLAEQTNDLNRVAFMKMVH